VIAWAMFLECFGFRATTSFERLLAGLAAAMLLLPVDRMIDYVFATDQKLFYETYAIGGVLIAAAFVMQMSKRPRPATA